MDADSFSSISSFHESAYNTFISLESLSRKSQLEYFVLFLAPKCTKTNRKKLSESERGMLIVLVMPSIIGAAFFPCFLVNCFPVLIVATFLL